MKKIKIDYLRTSKKYLTVAFNNKKAQNDLKNGVHVKGILCIQRYNFMTMLYLLIMHFICCIPSCCCSNLQLNPY